MADITLPRELVVAAISVTYAGLIAAVGWLARDNRRKDKDNRARRRKDAHTIQQAKFLLERADGIKSQPPPSIDQWKDDSAIIDAETMEAERYMERRQQGMDAADRTPEHIHYRRTPPKR